MTTVHCQDHEKLEDSSNINGNFHKGSTVQPVGQETDLKRLISNHLKQSTGTSTAHHPDTGEPSKAACTLRGPKSMVLGDGWTFMLYPPPIAPNSYPSPTCCLVNITQDHEPAYRKAYCTLKSHTAFPAS